MPRLVGLDRLRAAALLGMLFHHFTGWFCPGEARHVLPGWEGFALTDVAAPAFTVAAGASAMFLVAALEAKGRPVDRTIVRRYGLLVPMGVLLHTFLWQRPWTWGVLHVLGTVVVLSTLVARRLDVRWVGLLAALALGLGPVVRAVADDVGGVAQGLFGVGFPLVIYLGFALLGATGALLVRASGTDRAPDALLLGGLLTLLVAATTAAGWDPDRHPGTLAGFVLPGAAGSLLLYGAVARWKVPAVVDAVLRRAACHTLGIFLGHYGLYWVLRELGLLHRLDAGPAMALAAVATVAITLVAPFVPPLPWSPRTGRRQAPRTSASTSGTGRSSWA